MNNSKINAVNFGMMPKIDDMVTFSDRLIMYDNLDKPFSEALTGEMASFLDKLPKKIDFAIIFLCVEGEFNIRYNLKEITAGKGHLVVLVPGTVVEQLCFNRDARFIVITVPDQHYAPESSFQNATYVQKNFTSPIALQLDEDVFISGIDTYRQLKNALMTMGDKVNDDLVKAYIMVMAGLAAVNIQRWMLSHPDKPDNSREATVKQFLANVQEEHRSHRDVAFYAELAGLSPKYFAKIIHSFTGKHPLDWIRSYVVLDAKSMLKSGEYSIAEICEALNFSSRAQFNRYFKDETGLSPVEYTRS